MKFRAKISKDCLQSLLNTVLTFERISNLAAIFLNPDCVRISVITESIDSPKCFAEINVEALFLEYKIESQSANTILFEVALNQFSKALSSGKFAIQSQLKLVKREGKPCLCFETKADESIMSVDVCHDIPIKLMKSDEVVYYMPPQIPPPSVALDIPKGKLLKTIIDRMDKFSNHVYISACQSGRLTIRSEHSSVTIKTFYNGLQSRYIGELDPDRDGDNQVITKLSSRKLAIILNVHLLSLDFATLCFTQDEAVMLLVNLSNDLGTVSYYLPILIMDDDEAADGDNGDDNDVEA